MQVGFIFSLVFAIIVTVFAISNADSVLINFLVTKVEVSQALVIFISAALGAIIVTILGIIRQVKLTMKIKEQKKNINKLNEQKELLENRIAELSIDTDNSADNDNAEEDVLNNEAKDSPNN